MADGLEIKVDEDGSFKQAVERASHCVDDLSEPFRLISADFYRGQKSIWAQSGPGIFEDLAPSTKKSKLRKYGFLYPILKATGKLEQAASVAGGSGNITDIGPKELTLSVDTNVVPYSIFQGGRSFFFIESDNGTPEQSGREDRWIAIINQYLTKQLSNSEMGEVK